MADGSKKTISLLVKGDKLAASPHVSPPPFSYPGNMRKVAKGNMRNCTLVYMFGTKKQEEKTKRVIPQTPLQDQG
jgi:hypothetical protein